MVWSQLIEGLVIKDTSLFKIYFLQKLKFLLLKTNQNIFEVTGSNMSVEHLSQVVSTCDSWFCRCKFKPHLDCCVIGSKKVAVMFSNTATLLITFFTSHVVVSFNLTYYQYSLIWTWYSCMLDTFLLSITVASRGTGRQLPPSHTPNNFSVAFWDKVEKSTTGD